MATRKKVTPPSSPAQPSFAFPSPTLVPPEPEAIMKALSELEPGYGMFEERKLRLVPAPDRGPEEDVAVEPDGDRFAVSLIRHYGGSVATVLYSRRQLEMLLARIPAALEVG